MKEWKYSVFFFAIYSIIWKNTNSKLTPVRNSKLVSWDRTYFSKLDPVRNSELGALWKMLPFKIMLHCTPTRSSLCGRCAFWESPTKRYIKLWPRCCTAHAKSTRNETTHISRWPPIFLTGWWSIFCTNSSQQSCSDDLVCRFQLKIDMMKI